MRCTLERRASEGLIRTQVPFGSQCFSHSLQPLWNLYCCPFLSQEGLWVPVPQPQRPAPAPPPPWHQPAFLRTVGHCEEASSGSALSPSTSDCCHPTMQVIQTLTSASGALRALYVTALGSPFPSLCVTDQVYVMSCLLGLPQGEFAQPALSAHLCFSGGHT